MKINFLQHLPLRQSRCVCIQNSTMDRKPGIIRGDFSYERVGVQLYGSVIHDGGLYKMWYSPIPSVKSIRNKFLVAYAESNDGISWRKPILNVQHFESNSKNNLTDLPMHNPNVMLNPQPELYPYRFLAAGFIYAPYLDGKDYPENGFHLAGSQDGAHWEIISRNKRISPTISDVGCFHYDRFRKKYWAAIKEIDFSFDGQKRRSIGIADSIDLLEFPASSAIITPDGIADRQARDYGYEHAEYYGMQLWADESILFGFMWQLYTGAPFADNNPYGIWGPGDVRLFYCAESGPWQRAGANPVLQFNETERWLATGNIIESEDRNELFLYYSASNHGHAWFADRQMQFRQDIQERDTWDTIRIGLGRIEQDRLVGAYAADGFLEICLPATAGRGLFLNADASNGTVRTEVLSANNYQPIAGYSSKDAITVSGDSKAHPVLWRERAFLPEGELILRFFLDHATIYTLGEV